MYIVFISVAPLHCIIVVPVCMQMHDMREDPTLKCIRASFATPYSLQIALNLSGTLWGGSKLLIRKYKGPNHGKTNSNLLLAQNGFNLNGINNLPSNLTNMSLQDINQHTSQQQQMKIDNGINPLVNNGAINAGRGSNKTVAQQIFSHLDMQQVLSSLSLKCMAVSHSHFGAFPQKLAYLMLVSSHARQQQQFEQQQEKEAKANERAERRKKRKEEKSKGTENDGDKDDSLSSSDDDDDESDNLSDLSSVALEEKLREMERGSFWFLFVRRLCVVPWW